MHVFILTDQKFDLRTLPNASVTHIHQFRGHPEKMSREAVLQETRYLLDQLPTDFNSLENTFIVMEATSNTLAAYSMLLIALLKIPARPQIWILTEKEGFYMGLSRETAEADDWYQTHFLKQVEKAQISNLEKPDGIRTNT
jgi:hypothetical protein